MRAFARTLGAGCALLGMTATLGQDDGSEGPDVAFCGEAHNVSGGGRSGVVVSLYFDDQGGGRADAQWPGGELSGRFDGVLDHGVPCAKESLCMQLTGRLHELQDAGYPPDTSAPMVMALKVTLDFLNAQGVYHIEQLPSAISAQYGTMDLGLCGVTASFPPRIRAEDPLRPPLSPRPPE